MPKKKGVGMARNKTKYRRNFAATSKNKYRYGMGVFDETVSQRAVKKAEGRRGDRGRGGDGEP